MKPDIEGYLVLYALSDYIPVMNETEIVLLLNGKLPVDQNLIDKWESLLQTRRSRQEKIEAYAKQR